MCEHLRQLEAELEARGVPLTFRGQAWSHTIAGSGLILRAILIWRRFGVGLVLLKCVVDHVNSDPKSGREHGFVCNEHHDGVMGMADESGNYPTIR